MKSKMYFTLRPMISFRNLFKITPFPLKYARSSKFCGKRCEVCNFNSEADTFSSTLKGKTLIKVWCIWLHVASIKNKVLVKLSGL